MQVRLTFVVFVLVYSVIVQLVSLKTVGHVDGLIRVSTLVLVLSLARQNLRVGVQQKVVLTINSCSPETSCFNGDENGTCVSFCVYLFVCLFVCFLRNCFI